MTKRIKNQWTPYTSDIKRLSIYPQISTHEDPPLREGEVIVVSIYDIDEKGRGITKYKGFKVIVPNASSGSRVKVKIAKILSDDTAVGHIVSVLSESAD